MKTLNTGDFIRLEPWASTFCAKFYTVQGSAVEHGRDPKEADERALKNGHETAFSVYAGTALTSSPSYYENKVKEAESAITLIDGEQIKADDGRVYTVKVVRGNDGQFPENSDPIKFIPVE